jgi:MYXO-CTERM domain-containing protein
MFPGSQPGLSIRRSPETDDVAGACAIYPLKDDPGRCAVEDQGCSCGITEGSREGGLFLVALTLLLAYWIDR